MSVAFDGLRTDGDVRPVAVGSDRVAGLLRGPGGRSRLWDLDGLVREAKKVPAARRG